MPDASSVLHRLCRRTLAVLFVSACVVVGSASATHPRPCAIEIVERGTGWPVPLVELRTTHAARFVSDNAGRIAFDLPELMGRETWFDVIGHGYEVPKDGFGYRGVRLRPMPGGHLRVEVHRTTLARRLGRLTGAGLFAESQKLGRELDWPESGILGCDSVQNAVHGDRLFWLWGDTTLARYPLGIFHGTSATSELKPLARVEPPLRFRLDYFKDDQGAPRGVAPMPGEGPTWITGYVSLPDRSGKSCLVASYMKIKPPMDAYEWGLCVWNEGRSEFERLRIVWTKTPESPQRPPIPDGHPVFWQDATGRRWVLFGNPFPTLRCPATFEAWQDPAHWESVRPIEHLTSGADGTAVKPHSGSIAWNATRKRYVTVFLESFGKPSAFGELWYVEATSPTGPWGPAVKILTHENYTFYNPRIHPELSGASSSWLVFEGTYTMQFADRPHPTPRYDYNQVLYALDLADAALSAARSEPRPDRAGSPSTNE